MGQHHHHAEPHHAPAHHAEPHHHHQAPARQDDLQGSRPPAKRDEKGATFMTEATAAPSQSVRHDAKLASSQVSKAVEGGHGSASMNSVGESQQRPRLT